MTSEGVEGRCGAPNYPKRPTHEVFFLSPQTARKSYGQTAHICIHIHMYIYIYYIHTYIRTLVDILNLCIHYISSSFMRMCIQYVADL